MREIRAEVNHVLGELAGRSDCTSCSRVRITYNRARLARVAPCLIAYPSPDPHPPRNPTSVLAHVPMLAGTWVGQDGGRFTITQAAGARTVTWVGCSADGGRAWHHTFSGRFVGDSLVGQFQDTPPGASRNQGDLALDIVNEGKLVWIASLSIDGKVTNSIPTATRAWTRGSHGGCTAQAAANFSGDWTWKATNDTTKNVFIGPTPMSILQGAGGVVCSTWSFSGGGSAKGSLGGSTWSASWQDGFGKGTWNLTLTADGNGFKGSQTIDPHGAATAYKATIEGTRRSAAPGTKLDCATVKVGG